MLNFKPRVHGVGDEAGPFSVPRCLSSRLNLERQLQQEKTLRFVIDKSKVQIVETRESEGEPGVAGAEEKD